MKITINEILVLERVVRERVNDLKSMRGQVSMRQDHYMRGELQTTNVPQFDAKAIEAKITELNNFLLTADRKVKVSNAKTEVELDFDADKLLAPMQ